MNDEQKSHLIKFLDKGTRYDGRKLDEFRQISVEYGISKNAEGSASIKFGDTHVLAGVKMSIEKPYPDTPAEGNLMVGAELSPMSSAEFESGPPGTKAVELARVVDRGIRESKAMDTKTMCIEKGEKVWTTSIDVVTVNADGNLIDASSLAALAAMKDTKLPEYDEKEGKLDYKTKSNKKLPLKKTPIAVTIFKIGPHLILDPTSEEEELIDARLTVTVSEGKICAMQKGENQPLTLDEIEKMVSLAINKSKEIAKHL